MSETRLFPKARSFFFFPGFLLVWSCLPYRVSVISLTTWHWTSMEKPNLKPQYKSSGKRLYYKLLKFCIVTVQRFSEWFTFCITCVWVYVGSLKYFPRVKKKTVFFEIKIISLVSSYDVLSFWRDLWDNFYFHKMSDKCTVENLFQRQSSNRLAWAERTRAKWIESCYL